jgi:hypothetical protein
METNAVAETLSARETAGAVLPNQTVSDLTSWPPRMTWSFGHAMTVDLADTVVEVEWVLPADGLVGLRLAKADAQEYGVELYLPAAAVNAALEAIRPGIKLSAVGRVILAESSSRGEGVVAAAAGDPPSV